MIFLKLFPSKNKFFKNIITDLKPISYAEFLNDSIVLLSRQRPLETDVTGLNIGGVESGHSPRHGLAGHKTRTHRVGNPQVIRLVARSHHQSEGVLLVRFQVGYGDGILRGDVGQIARFRFEVLYLERLVLALRWIPGEGDFRVVDFDGVYLGDRLRICEINKR